MKLATDIYHVSGHCWKVFQDQRSRSWQGQLTCNWRGIHFDGVALRLNYFSILFSKSLSCNWACGCAELVQTKLGAHMENRVNSFLSQCDAADIKITVRVLACTSRSTEVKSYMRHRFPDAPASFPYTAKGIFAFQKIDGKDICFFGLHTQEYGSEVPQPNHRCDFRTIRCSFCFLSAMVFTAFMHSCISHPRLIWAVGPELNLFRSVYPSLEI